MTGKPIPLIVQYLYVHGQDEGFDYPTARSSSSAGVAARYLECALVQSASLRLRDVDCDLILATNVSDRRALGHEGGELLERIESLGVEIVPTEYLHRPGDNSTTYMSSRYVLDAIVTVTEGQPAARRVWLTDLDCVWANAERVFDATPPEEEVGCIHMDYPPDWDAVGYGHFGLTPNAIAEIAASMGVPQQGPAKWVGGELLTGTPSALRKLVGECDALDAQLAEAGEVLAAEEQILSLAGALGRVRFRDLEHVARRLATGPRHKAPKPENAQAFGLWHLPAEKGLSMRRTAQQIRRGRTAPFRRDLAEPTRLARRFNVEGAGLGRRIRDDGWLVKERLAGAVGSALDRR
jgi:hypothetical protein